MFTIEIKVPASSMLEAMTKGKHVEKILVHADVEVLKILADKASPKTIQKLKQFKSLI